MTKTDIKFISNQSVEFSTGKDPFEKVRQKGSSKWLISHIFHGSNKILVIIIFFFTIISASLGSFSYILIGNAINEFMLGNDSNLIDYVLLLLLLNIGSPVIRLVNYWLREVLAHRMERDVRKEFYVNLLGKSQSFHDQQQIGDLMARVTDDVRLLNSFISPAITLIFESFIYLVIPIIYVLFYYPLQLLLVPIIFAILFIISLRTYVRNLGPIMFMRRKFFGMMNTSLNETLTGIEVVKATVQEHRELDKYYTKAELYKNAFQETGKVRGKYLPFLFVAIAMTVGLTHGILIYLISDGLLLSIGTIIAYLGLLGMLRFPTQISIMVFGIVRIAIASSNRLLELMNRTTDIGENIEGVKKTINGGIKFENVSFSYPGSDKLILKNINFQVLPGQTVAIVGTTGSGKTTLTKLISRLYDVDSGRILIDNIDVKNFTLASLRGQISYIEQDIFLFSDTLFNNISFGRTSSLEEIIEVAKEAQAHDFINQLPDKYDSEVGERGVQLSGGERQRVAIARAFLSDPRILILDDSTSAIDSNTEDKIQRAIRNILKNRTTFIITHRLSQIRWADIIIVLKSGEITTIGTHEHLLRTSKEYQKIFIKKFDVDIDQLLKKDSEDTGEV